ncbi:MAG: hypothetical protein H7067_10465, partial [Burkholderiales bacterium]|nr:hypothetical protein [Opitutaceae bacterium]
MHKEIPWIVSLCVQEGVLDAKRGAEIAYTLAATDDSLAFGQALLDQDITTDVELLNRLVEECQTLAVSGAEAPPLAFPPPSHKAHAAQDPAWLAVQPANIAAPAGNVDFSAVAGMPDSELKCFMLGLLTTVQGLGASDLHLSAGSPPYVRNMRALSFLNQIPLTAAEAKRLNLSLLAPDEVALFEKKHDYDYALAMDGGRRIRVNLMEHKEGVKGTYRIVPEHVRNPAELGFKNTTVIEKLLSYHNGLILVTGADGAGDEDVTGGVAEELFDNGGVFEAQL